jgi:4-carboxymuconolactone decarboxylase
LELREISMFTCTALVAMGKESQLKTHRRGALNAGISPQAIDEMMTHLAHYSGWPTAVSGFRVAREVFKEMDA